MGLKTLNRAYGNYFKSRTNTIKTDDGFLGTPESWEINKVKTNAYTTEKQLSRVHNVTF